MTFSTIQQGSTGPDVIRLQEALKQLNYYSGAIDGDFGPGTKQAVINFQQAQGLTADGIVGPNTWSEINQMLDNSLPQDQWRRMTESEEIEEIRSLIDSRMGVGALNQLALEGFVGFGCTRSFYVNELYGGFQTLMRVKCDPPRGASTAIGYHEVRVIFNRFEDNIENYSIERVSEETGAPEFELPD
ncbi:MAG: peptidoglycan-binding domain-containing protein [Cyanobacteria bacterium P01_A01_bin.68]